MLVLAGPGSGKTTVISERVRYLIEQQNVQPDRILIITFTKAAAAEMQRRCRKICPQADLAVFGTFHSVFYHILRKSEKYQNFTLINEKEKKKIMKKIIPAGMMTSLQHSHACDSVLKKISVVKNSQCMDEQQEPEFSRVMERYCRLCEEQEKLDFDDMLVLCRKLLTENEAERQKWQERFLYILVDEFQDINSCQYDIIRILTKGNGNLFVVGDDDQAIYSFRGSDPGFMRQFLLDFPGSQKVCLEENYRSAPEIVRLAGKSIGCNENRFTKKFCAMRQCAEQNVTIKKFDSMQEEAEAVAVQILQMSHNVPKENIAVLVRTNRQAEYFSEVFYQKKIPCSVKEKRRCLYEHPWVCDILAMLRFASCGQKRGDFLMFMNKPFRGIERAMLKTEKVDFQKLQLYKEIAPDIKKLESIIKMMADMDPYGAVMLALNGLKYKKYMEEISAEQAEEIEQELLQRAKNFDNVPQFLKYAQEYVASFKENLLQQSEGKTEEHSVQLLTYHAAKGLEFEYVFIPMLIQGIVPHGHMLTKAQMEEERRMFYVAVTRAKQFLWFSWNGKEGGAQESVFLKELQADEIGT